MNEVGPDPQYRSILMFYPNNAGANLLLADTTITAPTVTATRKNTNKTDGALEYDGKYSMTRKFLLCTAYPSTRLLLRVACLGRRDAQR
jgi:hypothetical protein